MEQLINNIPGMISLILTVVLILTVITNIIVQVLKKVTWDKIPTNILAVIVALVLTVCAFFAGCQLMGVAVVWYMVLAAVIVGFFVAFAAMFGFDKFRQAMEQIVHIKSE